MDPEIRIAELRCACDALGIAEPILLGYRDSGMENWEAGPKPGSFVLADMDEVVERIAGEIRRLRPAVVVTFDSGGGYGHPDHRRVSEATTAAFERLRGEPDAPRALYHQVTPRSWAEQMVESWSEGDTRPDAKPPTEDDILQRQRFIELARPDDEITTRVDVRAGPRSQEAGLRLPRQSAPTRRLGGGRRRTVRGVAGPGGLHASVARTRARRAGERPSRAGLISA